MRVAVGADHAGFPLKEITLKTLRELGHEPIDFGGDGSDQQDDYPDYAKAVGSAIQNGSAERGVLLCGSGVGASVAINKMRGLRGALCHDLFSARQGVEDDDIHVLCLGARVIDAETAAALITAFMNARFSGLERHARRLAKVLKMEEECIQ